MNLPEISLMMLRHMSEEGLLEGRGVPASVLKAAVGLTPTEFDAAQQFLLQDGLIAGYGAGDDAIRWITPSGVRYVNQEMKGRVYLTLPAERVLTYLVNHTDDNDQGGDPDLWSIDLADGLGMSWPQYGRARGELVEAGLAAIIPESYDWGPETICPTRKGRQLVEKKFREFQPTSDIHAGAIINGPVMGGNIQAVASAIGSDIRQINVANGSPEELRLKIGETLEGLLAEISPELDLQVRAAYTKTAADFRDEVANPEPNAGKMQKWLAALGLLSDLGGAIDFSKRTFDLIVKAGPYLLLLEQLVQRLLLTMPH